MNKIGIIGAMELEIEQLKNEMTIENTSTKASIEFYEGTLNDAKILEPVKVKLHGQEIVDIIKNIKN